MCERASERANKRAKDSQMLKLIKQYRVLLEISFNVFDPNVNSKQSSLCRCRRRRRRHCFLLLLPFRFILIVS